MIKLFSSIFYLCLSARGCVHPVTRTYTQNPAQPKNNCIQMNLYKSLVPMVSSSETHTQHKRPHKLLDRLFLNNCQTAWTWLPFRGTPRQGRRIIRIELGASRQCASAYPVLFPRLWRRICLDRRDRGRSRKRCPCFPKGYRAG